MRRFTTKLAMGLAGLGLLSAAPVAAQRMSEGFEFLKAVKERDGTKVTASLDKPGTTVVNTRDVSSGEGALHIVVQRRDNAWLQLLLAKGANPNIADARGITPLQIASGLGWVEGVELLVKKGASVDSANLTGETSLIAAVHRRDLVLVKALLKGGANPDRSDNSGRSARDYAALMGPQNEIAAELDRASAERKARATKAYGPGL